MADDSGDDSSMELLATLDDEKGLDGSEHHQQEQEQEQEQHHYLRSIEATVITRQLPSRGLSFQLWPAASSLVSLLDGDPTPLRLPSTPHPLRILELGSGTGLVGIAAAALLGARVTITDLPHVLPNLRFNAHSNAASVAARGGSVVVRQLTWGDSVDLASLLVDESFDVVMASDVVYYDHLFDPLLQTLRPLVTGEVVFLMAHLRRWKKRDALFFRKARKLFDVAVVYTDPPLTGCRIGVATYRFTGKGRQ